MEAKQKVGWVSSVCIYDYDVKGKEKGRRKVGSLAPNTGFAQGFSPTIPPLG